MLGKFKMTTENIDQRINILYDTIRYCQKLRTSKSNEREVSNKNCGQKYRFFWERIKIKKMHAANYSISNSNIRYFPLWNLPKLNFFTAKIIFYRKLNFDTKNGTILHNRKLEESSS